MKAKLVSLALLLTTFGYVAYFYNALPQQVPSHFDFAGKVNHWDAKSFLFPVLLAVQLGMNLMLYLLALGITKIPPAIVNVPWKQYWFGNEQRKVLSYAKLRSILTYASIMTNFVFLYVIHTVIQASGATTIYVPPTLGVGVIFASVGVLLASIFLTFRPPSETDHPKS